MKSKITIIYKSGIKIHAKADKFTVASYRDGSTDYEWENLKPEVLKFGADEVAAVYKGHI